ncbi:hypothetical protein ACOMHN_015897 [Nucella lapillus]
MGEDHEGLTSLGNIPLVSITDTHNTTVSSDCLEEDQARKGGKGKGKGRGRKAEGCLERDVLWGVLCWKPQCLQRFNNPHWLLFFFSLYALSLVQGLLCLVSSVQGLLCLVSSVQGLLCLVSSVQGLLCLVSSVQGLLCLVSSVQGLLCLVSSVQGLLCLVSSVQGLLCLVSSVQGLLCLVSSVQGLLCLVSSVQGLLCLVSSVQGILCLVSSVQGLLCFVVNGINNVNTTAIEQRFNLASATVGLISSAYDVSAAILGLLISYFGAGRHKARMVGIAVIVSSLGSILMALPHFTTGPYSLGKDSVTSVCLPLNGTARESSSPERCQSEAESGLSSYLYMFILGQMLHGVGGTTIYTVGVTLIDDSVRPSSTPLYLGILYGSAMLGPGLGYVVGGQFLSYYVDFNVVDTKMTPDDPRWVGAWWLGFVLTSVVNLMVSLPILCFGAELPSAKHIRQIRVSQAHTQAQEGKKEATTEGVEPNPATPSQGELSLRHFVQTSLTLLSNPCFLFISLSMVSESISLSGVATFLPKMIEKKFRVSASKAAMWSGLAVVPSAASGQFLGGFVAQRMKLSIPGLIKLCIVGFLLTFLFVGIVWIDCGREEFVGITLPYPTSVTHEDVTLTSSCNAACLCSTEVFSPACDHNKTMYFSPCHAGCVRGPQEGVR